MDNNLSSLQAGTLLQGGKYRIVRFINSGGFGCTYEAEHVMLENRVAIKEFFVKDFCNRDETTSHVTVGTLSKKALVHKLLRKFVDEARAICKLHHPGIVTVSDIFEENGTAYFVMDYIEGRSLSQMVKSDGPLSEAKALGYIRQVAEALGYVHDHNRLHLDVKPGNIMVDASDRAILIDFGASKQYDEQDGENTSTLMGKTPGYAPLEQMGNDVVRFMPATDIYSLGATLYKLLTGITPLSANLLASGEELPPLPDAVSASTRRAIAAAMQINKNKRPQSIGEFLELLGMGEEPIKKETEDDEDTKPVEDEDTKPTPVLKPQPKPAPAPKPQPAPTPSHKPEPKVTEVTEVRSKPKSSSLMKWMIPLALVVALICIFWLKGGDDVKKSVTSNGFSYTINGVTFKMVSVKGGTFQMGATSEQQVPNDDELPVHSVTLSDYYIGETEVTQALWTAVMGSNPSKRKGDHRPVEQVTWDECQTFIRKLNQLTGETFRLPTEAEWEYAARGGNKSRGYQYSGSNNLDDVAWYYYNSGSETHAVKTKRPNELGLYDMSGNVYEWCQDWKGRYSSSAQTNPTGPSSGSSRVSRGGSWCNLARYCRVSSRGNGTPDRRSDDLGLRLSF